MPEGGDLSQGTPALIQPDVELFVAVTVHDLRGNVYIDELTQASVTPIDNLNDNTPPDRLTDITLRDRPQDDGTALLLEFELSDADDVQSYHIYAADYNFEGGDIGAQSASFDWDALKFGEVGRTPNFPIVIDIVNRDIPVNPDIEVWVAVVVMDSAGNAHTDMLTLVSASSTNEGITDPGVYLPDIQEVEASWENGATIRVDWRHSFDASVRGYRVFIAEEAFSTTDNATLVGDTTEDNFFEITAGEYERLDNGSTYYVAVVPYDEMVAKSTVEAVKVDPLNPTGSSSSNEDGGSEFSLESLLTTPNLIAAGMLLIVLLLVVLIVRTRSSSKQRSKTWELQEATWGIQDASWDTPVSSTPAAAPAQPPQPPNDLYNPSRTQAPDYERVAYQPTQPVLRPKVDQALLDGLLDDGGQTKQPEIDTSFLDDLL